MINYSDLKKRNLIIKANSSDCWKAGDMVMALGIDKEKSDFTYIKMGLDLMIKSGIIVFNNGRKITIVNESLS